MSYDHVIDKNIFPSFICSCIPSIDMSSLLEETYMIRDTYNDVDNSNRGGYHSPGFTSKKKQEFESYQYLGQLVDDVESFSQDVLANKNIGGQIDELYFWININKEYNYNVIHNHGRSDLIAIYYLKVPVNSGNFVVLRNDGSHYSNLYENRKDMLELNLEPEEGRLYLLPGHLWHYVEASRGDQDRVSISFNIQI